MAPPKLVYVTDPMCSWCWGFAPVLDELRELVGERAEWELVLGGLAPDSDEPMPDAIRAYVQDAWRTVSRTAGVEFNWDFWTHCSPRRSTYPACRAVIVAGQLRAGADWSMFAALQRAYYLEARNPSLEETLVEVAGEQGLERESFRAGLRDPATQRALEANFVRRRQLGADAFPSIGLEGGGVAPRLLARGYAPFDDVRSRVERALRGLQA